MVSGLINGAVALAVVWGLVVGGLYLGQRRILFVPDPTRPDRLQAGLTMMEEVRLATDDGLELVSWYRPAREGLPTLVFFHGNAGHIGHRGAKANAILARGLGLLLVGYRGYGGNPGDPSEAGFATDARAAVDFLRGRGVSPDRLVFYGESLGTGVAVPAAVALAEAGSPAAAVVLEAPFASIVEEAARRYWYVPVRALVKDRFDTIASIHRVGAPLLIVHGERDRVLPVSAGAALAARARDPKRFIRVREAGHNDLLEHGLIEEMMRFLADHEVIGRE